MTATALPPPPNHEFADLSAAFGPLFGVLHKELFNKIVPAERTVMLRQVSKGARHSLMAAKPAAVVKARGGGGRIADAPALSAPLVCMP